MLIGWEYPEIMNSKKISKRLVKLGYKLGREGSEWVATSEETGFKYYFPTLGRVSRFATEQQAMTDYAYRDGF